VGDYAVQSGAPFGMCGMGTVHQNGSDLWQRCVPFAPNDDFHGRNVSTRKHKNEGHFQRGVVCASPNDLHFGAPLMTHRNEDDFWFRCDDSTATRKRPAKTAVQSKKRARKTESPKIESWKQDSPRLESWKQDSPKIESWRIGSANTESFATESVTLEECVGDVCYHSPMHLSNNSKNSEIKKSLQKVVKELENLFPGSEWSDDDDESPTESSQKRKTLQTHKKDFQTQQLQ